MDYIALIIALVILLAAGYRGYHAGAIRMILYVAILIFTTVISGILAKPISYAVKENTSLYTNIENSVASMLREQEFVSVNEINQLPFPDYMLDEIPDNIAAGEDLVMAAAKVIASQIFYALVYICLNIVIYVAVRIVVGTFGIVSRLPIIRELNKLAGFVIGLVEGILVLWLLCLLLQACGSEAWAQDMFIQIKANDFLNWIYNHNLIAAYIGKFV
jgi:hypothetical protein